MMGSGIASCHWVLGFPGGVLIVTPTWWGTVGSVLVRPCMCLPVFDTQCRCTSTGVFFIRLVQAATIYKSVVAVFLLYFLPSS